MTNPIFGIALVVAAAAASFLGSSNSVMASNIITNEAADVDVEEAALAGNASIAAGPNETTEGNMTDVQFMFIQRAQSGSLSQINETAHTLELNNVANETILFSDRPNRIVETVSTADFIGNWSTGPDSFAADAPNDALIVENTQTGQLETAVVESFNPMYDANTNTLTYTIAAENATTTIDLPYEFGQSILIVDGFLIL